MFEPEVEYTYWPPEPSLPYEPYRGGYTTHPTRSQQQAGTARTMPAAPARLQRPEQVKQTTPRMSKAEALAFVEQCKKWLVTGSVVAFGVLTGLVASHVIGSTSQGVNPSNNQAAPSFNSPSTSPSDDGGFFQQGGNNFGNGNSGQQPSSGSHTS